ncbi:MAG: type IV secretion system DNA-binding domain-containing protein [Ardenticatenaceae bacterium]|nr:type IV secretion system DNA-binding domain-containing protein [Ardenticatenaceae bacterium]
MTDLAQIQVNKTEVLEIYAPTSSPWQPKIAERLMISIFSIYEPLSLIINANAQAITWRIEVPQKKADTLRQILFGIYPQATINNKPKTSSAVGMTQFSFQVGLPFVYPLMFASELPELDPLAAVTSSFGILKESEQIVYELRLRTMRQEYRELGLKLLQEQPIIDVKGKLIENKILKEVEFMVKIKAPDSERAYELIGMVQPALAVFNAEGFNFLTPAQKEAYNLVLTAEEVAALWHLPTEQCGNPRIKWAHQPSAPAPQFAFNDDEYVVLGRNAFQTNTQEVKLSYKDRVDHVNILGSTRVGKSTLMHRMIHQDILAGKSVGVIDPHGSLVEEILRSSIPYNREKDVILLDINDTDYPIGLNLLNVPPNMTKEEVVAHTVSAIRNMFEDSWSHGRMETVLKYALTTLMTDSNSTIMDVQRFLGDSDFRSKFYNEITDPMALQYWRNQYEPAQVKAQADIAAPIVNRLSKFDSPSLRNIFCQQSSLDISKMLDQRTIFLADLGGMSAIEAETLGAMLVTKIQIAAMGRSRLKRSNLEPFFLYIDEVQHFVTTSLDKLFSEAGKHGLSLVVANQYLYQLRGETLEAVMGNAGTNIFFRLGDRDASAIAPFVKPHFASSDLQSMGRFRAVVKMKINAEYVPAFNIQTLNPIPNYKDAEFRKERIRAHSRMQYAQKRQDVEREINKRLLANKKISLDFLGNKAEDNFFD